MNHLVLGISATTWRHFVLLVSAYYSYYMLLLYYYILNSVVAPTLAETPSKQTITEGMSVTFHCTASGNPVPQIKWIKDDTVVGEGETLTFDALRNRSGEYWCIADNGLNDTANASAYLGVHCKYGAVWESTRLCMCKHKCSAFHSVFKIKSTVRSFIL